INLRKNVIFVLSNVAVENEGGTDLILLMQDSYFIGFLQRSLSAESPTCLLHETLICLNSIKVTTQSAGVLPSFLSFVRPLMDHEDDAVVQEAGYFMDRFSL
ncbi:MAG: hypothetical protein ACQUHE_17345, partial [Bacteroidia bacterium]